MLHWAVGSRRKSGPASSPALKAAAIAAGASLPGLARAESLAASLRVPLDVVLVNEGIVSEERLYRAVASLLRLTFLPECPRLAPPGDPSAARTAGSAPCSNPREAGFDIVLAPRGRALALLLDTLREAMPPGARIAVSTPSAFSAALRQSDERRIARSAARTVAGRSPSLSARGRPRTYTFMILPAVMLALVLTAVRWPAVGDIVAAFFALLLLSTALLRIIGVVTPRSAWIPARLKDRDLPDYTVLVPLFREVEIVPQLIAALRELDYPRARLDVKLLLEEDDRPTLAAVRAMRLPGFIEVVVCPPGVPRTKPRALNIGLASARGTLVCVFDAEDRPDPGQLRLAAERFASDPDLACLQASLIIDNPGDGWLARMFALEYAVLFDVLLPGLAARGLPLPLGGTSNHFRRAVLEQAGAWDAWNVTEDADLGLRLARLGLRTETLASVTREAAPARLRVWFWQRTRWLKGWMQTAMVHGFAPGQSLGGYRLADRLTVLSHAAGTAGTALFFPIGTVALPLWLMEETSADEGRVLHAVSVSLACTVPLLGFFAMIWPPWLAARRRGLRFGVTDALLLIPYYLLVSAAAWTALVELFTAPSHWRKTDHAPAASTGPAHLTSSVPAASPRRPAAARG
jgi:cellulose synthase/poly-beta-1,6-N-acetylglucosamine synthase-like glycosyltransferase